MQLTRLFNCFTAINCFSAHFPARMIFEQCSNSMTDDLMVVGDQNPKIIHSSLPQEQFFPSRACTGAGISNSGCPSMSMTTTLGLAQQMPKRKPLDSRLLGCSFRLQRRVNS